MKFNKVLKSGDGAQSADGAGSLYVRYGALKKQLKVMAIELNDGGSQSSQADAAELAAKVERIQSGDAAAAAPQRNLTAQETAFLSMLNEDMAKFNAFFMDAEEDAVIRLDCLKKRLAAAHGGDEVAAAKRDFVQFHGELILLLHWSALNLAGISKILKKHDKLTGHVLRAPYLANALQQPFYSTDCIERMVEDVEQALLPLSAPSTEAAIARRADGAGASDAATSARQDAAAAASPPDGSAQPPAAVPAAGAASCSRGQVDVLKRTQLALSMWQELGEKAHTPSTVLPPAAAAASPQKRRRVAQPVEVS